MHTQTSQGTPSIASNLQKLREPGTGPSPETPEGANPADTFDLGLQCADCESNLLLTLGPV